MRERKFREEVKQQKNQQNNTSFFGTRSRVLLAGIFVTTLVGAAAYQKGRTKPLISLSPPTYNVISPKKSSGSFNVKPLLKYGRVTKQRSYEGAKRTVIYIPMTHWISPTQVRNTALAIMKRQGLDPKKYSYEVLKNLIKEVRESSEKEMRVKEIQKNIYMILYELHKGGLRLVGIEGGSGEIKQPGKYNWYQDICVRDHPSKCKNPKELADFLMTIVPEAGSWFEKINQDKIMTYGLEDRDTHQKAMELRVDGNKLKEANLLVVNKRSHIAVDKLVRLMIEKDISYAVMTFGRDHEASIIERLENYNKGQEKVSWIVIEPYKEWKLD